MQTMTVGFLIRKMDQKWIHEIEQLRRDYPQHTFLSPEETEKATIIGQSDILVVMILKEAEAEKAERLKVLFVPFVGVNALPLHYCRENGIRVSNTHWNASFVAEKALGLTLDLLGRTTHFHNLLSKGIWGGFLSKSPENQNWDSLFEKKCTILGYGSIGRELAKLLCPFRCDITGYKRRVPDRTPDDVNRITNDLEASLDSAEIVYITLPLTKATENLFNIENMHLLENKYVVNVGRGRIVEEAPFYNALKNGMIKGAAIDVWYQYPKEESVRFPSTFPFHMLGNVVISPHTASDAKEGLGLWVDTTVSRLRAYLDNGTLENEVDLSREY